MNYVIELTINHKGRGEIWKCCKSDSNSHYICTMTQSVCVYVLSDRLQLWFHIIIIISNYYWWHLLRWKLLFLHAKCVIYILEMYIWMDFILNCNLLLLLLLFVTATLIHTLYFKYIVVFWKTKQNSQITFRYFQVNTKKIQSQNLRAKLNNISEVHHQLLAAVSQASCALSFWCLQAAALNPDLATADKDFPRCSKSIGLACNGKELALNSSLRTGQMGLLRAVPKNCRIVQS